MKRRICLVTSCMLGLLLIGCGTDLRELQMPDDNDRVESEEQEDSESFIAKEVSFAIKQLAMCDETCGYALSFDNEILYTKYGMEEFEVLRKLEGVSIANDGFADLCAVDAKSVYTSFISDNQDIYVEYTNDAGNTWLQTDISVEKDVIEGSGSVYIDFADLQHGYVLYCSSPAAGMMTKILFYTEDGGQSFQCVEDLTDKLTGYPNDITYVAGKCYISVSYHGEYNYLYVKENDSKEWKSEQIVPMTEEILYIDGMTPIFDSQDTQSGVLVLKVVDADSKYELFTTEDGGKSWIFRKKLSIDMIRSYDCLGNRYYFVDEMGRIFIDK